MADPLRKRAAVVFAADLAADRVPSTARSALRCRWGSLVRSDSASTSPPSPRRTAKTRAA